MTKIKLCGLMNVQDAAYANAVKPDLAGMVFARGRSRCISQETAREIRAALDGDIRAVGVFLDNPIAEITALAEKKIIQIVQLHGSEDAAYIMNLRALCNLPIIKAYSIRTPEDVKKAEHSDADIVLLDSGIGGTGELFDHKLLDGFTRPYFLAGGLTPENVAAAITKLHPYGVDVSSGIETDGKKDIEKIRAFAEQVRAAE